MAMELDGPCSGVNCKYRFSYLELCFSALSIVMRIVTIGITSKLAIDYYLQGQEKYLLWTIVCIICPMIVTVFIHANMRHQDGKFNKGIINAIQQWCLIFSCFLLRYCNSFMYAIQCKRAEIKGNQELQQKNYRLSIREESDIAFIRLFDCFLEAAPQKILQISIALNQIEEVTNLQIVAIVSYFGSMAWCLCVYHRYNRYVQYDKYNISACGVVLQLGWHFCISVSRTLCLAMIVSIFPLWSILACLSHAFIFSIIIFVLDSPKFSNLMLTNYLLCLFIGMVYIFTYISVKDAPTRYKYILYYIFCSLENIICIALFILIAADNHILINQYKILFHLLCSTAFSIYYIGIVIMIIYYLCYHPHITARNSQIK